MNYKYSVFIKSILAVLGITLFFLIIQSYSYFGITQEISNLFKEFSLIGVLNILKLMGGYFTLFNFIDVLFLVSLLFFCIYCFKWIIDQGAFYTFQYSWQKSKKHLLFFLPKYWGSSKHEPKSKDDEIDPQTGVKIYHSYEEFVEFKQSGKWDDLNQLFFSTIVLVVGCMIVSFMLI